MALLWPVFGSDLANRSGPPKCHHSTPHVAQIIILHVPDVGRIWADNMLLSGYPEPMCINNNKKKINPTRDRPDEIRPESDPTAFILNPTGPERKRIDVHSLQPRISPEKSWGPADRFGRCSITFINLFIYLLAYYFICLPA